MPDLLPADDAELRRATWRSHFGHDEPLPSLMSELRDCYSEDIRLLRDETERDFREFHEERLVHYVMVLYLRGRLPDDLLKQFWRDARPQIRRHAVWFVAEQISRPSTEVPNDVKARGLAYWEARLAEAKI